uniref:Uncharacterized protein n=1 Tax=Plectus sambesii TaxID=2011161 RepID=A0A914VBU1_9BILA
MVESTNVLGKARLLGIKSLRPPVISPCRFNGQQYDLIKRLVMRKSTEKGQFVQMDESFDDDDLAEIDRAMDSECPKSAYEEVVTPLVETIEAVVESEYASVGSNGSNFITRPTNIM